MEYKNVNRAVDEKGFTLVELAIVIVVLGIVTVGVVSGRSIIETANINSTVSKLTQYNTALNAFKLEFDGIPGDFDEAEDYGLNEDASGNENVCWTLFTNVDGNGNGFLNGPLNGQEIPSSFRGEIPNYFIHLSNSGLINDAIVRQNPGTGGCGSPVVAGKHFPAMKIGEGLIVVSDFNNKKLYYVLGGFGGTRLDAFFRQMEERTDGIAGNLMTAREAKRIEAKIDDENPLRGISKVIMYYAGGTFAYDSNDNDTNCVYNSEYNVGYDENACTLAIEVGKF